MICFLPDDPPVAICQDVTVSANDTCAGIVVPEQVDNGSFDPDADSLIFTLFPEGPFEVGSHEVILTVTDTTGLSAECAAIVTVVDDMLPEVYTKGVVTYLDSSGVVSVSAADLDDGSTDNCGIAEMTLDVYDFSCQDLGENFVTLTVVDIHGNSSFAVDTVTVMDTIAPRLTVIADPVLLWPPNHKYHEFGVDDFVVSVWDNCPLPPDAVHIYRATSDEPENGNGDGDTEDDMVIGDDCQTISLRSERQGGGDGRVYTVYLALKDSEGQADSAVCFVHVPHNQGSTTGDDGVVYEVESDCSVVSGSGQDKPYPDNPFALECFPNPFNESASFKFSTDSADFIDLRIFSMEGNLVKVIHSGELPAGDHTFTWTGAHDNGIRMGEGVYLLRISSAGQSGYIKVVRY